MGEEHTTVIVQRYLDELAGGSPSEPVIRALLDRAVRRLHQLCATLLYRSIAVSSCWRHRWVTFAQRRTRQCFSLSLAISERTCSARSVSSYPMAHKCASAVMVVLPNGVSRWPKVVPFKW
jgi:hypothetical protein